MENHPHPAAADAVADAAVHDAVAVFAAHDIQVDVERDEDEYDRMMMVKMRRSRRRKAPRKEAQVALLKTTWWRKAGW